MLVFDYTCCVRLRSAGSTQKVSSSAGVQWRRAPSRDEGPRSRDCQHARTHGPSVLSRLRRTCVLFQYPLVRRMTRLRARRTTKMKADIWLLILMQLFRVCSSDVSPTQSDDRLMYGADARPSIAVANPMFGDMSVAATAIPGKSPLAPLSEEHSNSDWSHIHPFGSPGVHSQPAPLPSPPSGVPRFTSVTTLTDYSSVDRVVELDTNDGPEDSRPTDGLSQPLVPSGEPELSRDARSVLLTDDGDDDDDGDDKSDVTFEVTETTEIVIPDEYLPPQPGRPLLQQEETQLASETHLSPSSFAEGMYFPPLAPEASPTTAVSFEYLPYVTTSQNTQYPWQALTPISSTLGNYQFEPDAYSSNYYQGDYFQPPLPLPSMYSNDPLFSMPYQFTDYNIPLQPYPLPPYAVNSHIPNPPYPNTFSGESDFLYSPPQRNTSTSTSFESLPQKTINSNSYTDDPFLTMTGVSLTSSNYQLPQQMSFPNYYPLREKTFDDTYQSQYNYWSPRAPVSSNPAGITPFLVPPFPFGACPAMPVGTNQNFPSPMGLSFMPPQAAYPHYDRDLSRDQQPAISDDLISFGDYTPTSQSVTPVTSYYPEDYVLSPSEYISPHQIFAEHPHAEYPVSDLDYPLYPETVAVHPPGYPTGYVLPPRLPEGHFSPQFPETYSPVRPPTAGHPLTEVPDPYGSNIPPLPAAPAPVSYLEDYFVSPPFPEPVVSHYSRDLDLPLSSTEFSVPYEIFDDYPSIEPPMPDFTTYDSTYFSPDYTLAAPLDYTAADPLAYTADYFLPPSLTEQHFPPQFLEEYSLAGYPMAGDTPAVTYPYDYNIPSPSYTPAPVSYPADYFVPTPYPQKYFSIPPTTPYYPGSSLLPHFPTEFEEYLPAEYQPAEYPPPILTSADNFPHPLQYAPPPVPGGPHQFVYPEEFFPPPSFPETYDYNIPSVSPTPATVGYPGDFFVPTLYLETYFSFPPMTPYYPGDSLLPHAPTEFDEYQPAEYQPAEYQPAEYPLPILTSADNFPHPFQYAPPPAPSAPYQFVYPEEFFPPPSFPETYDYDIPSVSPTPVPIGYPGDYFVPTPHPQTYFSVPPMTPYYPENSLLPNSPTEFDEYHPAGYQPAEFPQPILTSADDLPHPYQYAHPPLPTIPHQFVYPGQFFLHTLQHPLPVSPIGNTDPYPSGQHVPLLSAASFPLSYPQNTSPLTFTGTHVSPPLLEGYRPEENLPVGFISEHDAFPYPPGHIAPVGYPANPFEPAFFPVEDLMEPSLVPDYQLPLLAPPINLDQYGSYSFPPFAEFPPEPTLPEENFLYTHTENNMPLTMDYVPLPYMSPSSWIRPHPSFVEPLPPAEYPPVLPPPLPLHPFAENALQTLLPTEYPAVFEEDYLLPPSPLGTDSLKFLPASFPFPFTYTPLPPALPETYLDPLQYNSELPPIFDALYPQDFSVEGPLPLYPGSLTVDPHFPEDSLLSPDTQILPGNDRDMSNYGPCPLLLNNIACGSLPPVILMLTCDNLSTMMPDLSGTFRQQLYTLLNQAGAQVLPPNTFSNWKPEPNYSQEPLQELPLRTLSENLVFPNIHLDWAPSPEVSKISQLSFDNYS